jgi:methylphosphotriester-DNA--protein-cysteine methyltransferase
MGTKIKPDNLVTFKSAKEAKGAGYVPCKVCKPPMKD